MSRGAVGADQPTGHGGLPVAKAWGWGTAQWRSRAVTLAALLAVLWLPTVIQQLSTRPGNLVQAYRFLTTHHSIRTLAASVRAADTAFGAFPFRLDEGLATHDAVPTWLLDHPIWDHPWYLLYLAGTVAVGIIAVFRLKLPALALAVSTVIAILAAGWSILLVYGPLYPYLVLWTGALVIPAWVALWLLVAPARSEITAEVRHRDPRPAPRLMVPLATVAGAVAVCTAFAGSVAPLTDGSAHLARRAWDAVAGPTLAPKVKTVYVEIANQNAMPEAAAIADEAIRYHRRVEINRNALFYLDPSFAPRWKAQLRIVVCCTRGTSLALGRGLDFRAQVGGQRIYTLASGQMMRPARRVHQLRVPGVGRSHFERYLVGDVDDRLIHSL
jgi:hypothetical protein